MPHQLYSPIIRCTNSAEAIGLASQLLVDGIQVHNVMAVNQSKSGNVWIYNTLCTLHWLHLEPTHLVHPPHHLESAAVCEGQFVHVTRNRVGGKILPGKVGRVTQRVAARAANDNTQNTSTHEPSEESV
jgi:hypothetical protein